MNTDLLRIVAVCYFKDVVGGEPDTLIFTHENHSIHEFSLDVTFGSRKFEMWMWPGGNIIRLTEKRHQGTFDDAAALAGMDRNLNDLK